MSAAAIDGDWCHDDSLCSDGVWICHDGLAVLVELDGRRGGGDFLHNGAFSVWRYWRYFSTF